MIFFSQKKQIMFRFEAACLDTEEISGFGKVLISPESFQKNVSWYLSNNLHQRVQFFSTDFSTVPEFSTNIHDLLAELLFLVLFLKRTKHYSGPPD
jgi:hypothetical protein